MHTYQPTNLYNHSKNQHYLVEHNKQLKCICELCTCGRHQCPRKGIKTDFETSYARQFKKLPNLPQNDARPAYKYEDRHYSPDMLKTHYQQNYHEQVSFPASMSNSRLQDVGKTVLAPQVPFVGVTSYNQQYQTYNMVRKQDLQNPELDILTPYKSQEYIKSSTKFQGISSYKSSYLPPPQMVKSSPTSPYKKPQIPFYGVSSYKEQYKPIQFMSPEKSYEKSPYNNSKGVRFQGKSAYTQQFQPYKSSQYNEDPYDSRISILKNQCKLDEVAIPNINYINNKDHLQYDPESRRFY